MRFYRLHQRMEESDIRRMALATALVDLIASIATFIPTAIFLFGVEDDY